ncbi:hypothetical protein AB0M02_32080 [Actinoplanes sp. NPDC051861]
MPEVTDAPTEPAEPVTAPAEPEPAATLPQLIMLDAGDAPTCTDGVCL